MAGKNTVLKRQNASTLWNRGEKLFTMSMSFSVEVEQLALNNVINNVIVKP